MAQWHCSVKGRQYGPIDEAELRRWIAEARITAQDLVWREGMDRWVPAAGVPELGVGAAPATGPYAPAVGPDGRALKAHRGPLVLVLGILGIVLIGMCAPLNLGCSIPAWVMGNRDMAEMDAGVMDPQGRSTAQAGKICGIIGTLLTVIGGAVLVIVIVLAVLAETM